MRGAEGTLTYVNLQNTLEESIHDGIIHLKSYNSITYDAIGNPTSYYNGTRWTNGRSLATASKSGTSLSFAYDANGLRTSKTVNGTTYRYYYAGGKLMRMTWGTNTIDFFYDASGLPYAMKYNGTVYYYVTNLQGDVMRIVDASQNIVTSYEYDPYGKVISATGTLANVNPLRYRGYVYDQETGFYYLQSRYYDPTIGRFINLDAYVSTGAGIIGYNMFAYCNGNPVSATDNEGSSSESLADIWVGSMGWLPYADGPIPVTDAIFAGVFGILCVIDAAQNILYAKGASKAGKFSSSLAGSAASPPDPNDKNNRNWQKVNEKYLEKRLAEQGTDPHQLKRDYLGRKEQIKYYDIYVDKATGQLAIFQKSTGNLVVITDYFI